MAAAVLLVACMAALSACGSSSQNAVKTGRATAAAGSPRSIGGDDERNTLGSPNVCGACAPPQKNDGGPVSGTQPTPGGPVTQPGRITVTPIYWAPGGLADFPAGYATIINRYITDLAADSGKTTNAYSVVTEYTAPVNGVETPFEYAITAGTPIVDTTPFPPAAAQCTPSVATFTTCLRDTTTIQPELSAVLAAKGLTPSLGQIYVLMLPPGVQTKEGDGYSGDSFCAVHQVFTDSAGRNVSYADQPYDLSCAEGQTPDWTSASVKAAFPGYEMADGQVNAIFHELIEAVTDPMANAYGDGNGQEIGDECGGFHGKARGSTNPASKTTTSYNQVINGHKYYTQTGFSNLSFAAGNGCIQGAFGSPTATAGAAAKRRAADAPDDIVPDVGSVTVNAADSAIPADDTSTTAVTITVVDTGGAPIAGDAVRLRTSNANQGNLDAQAAQLNIDTGHCGTIETPEDGFVTNDSGQVFATYTASHNDGPCSIEASELIGGTSNDTIVFQGTSNHGSPSLTQSLPTTVIAGGPPVTFTTNTQNPGDQELFNTTQKVYLSGASSGDTGLKASDVTLSYADYGTNGAFVKIDPVGDTANGGYIEGDLDVGSVVNYPPGASNTITFKLAIAKDAPDSATTGAPLTIQSEFDQINLADDLTTNVDYAYGDSFVLPAKATTTTPGTPAPIIVTTPASTTTTIIQPTQTTIQTIPGPTVTVSAKPCTVPSLKGKNVTQVQAALKKARCATTTLIVPTAKKGRKVVFARSNPARGRMLSAGHVLKVTFKSVTIKKKNR